MIGEKAAKASLEPFIQPELGEAFFCRKLLLVEGPEDRAILHTALEQAEEMDAFLKGGGHIVCANGKPGLLNMIAIARGFEIPYFVMFDADTDCGAADVPGTKALNAKVIALMKLGEKNLAWPDKDVIGAPLTIWKNDIQSALETDYKDWISDVKKVCEKFGWTYDRLKKNPAVVAYALSAALAAETKFPCLEKLRAAVLSFALA